MHKFLLAVVLLVFFHHATVQANFIWPTLSQENGDYNVLTLHDYLSITLGRPIASDSEFELTETTISELKEYFRKTTNSDKIQNKDGSFMRDKHWIRLISKAVQSDLYSTSTRAANALDLVYPQFSDDLTAGLQCISQHNIESYGSLYFYQFQPGVTRHNHLSSCVLRTKVENGTSSTSGYETLKMVHPVLEIATDPLPAEIFDLDILTIKPPTEYKDYVVEFQELIKFVVQHVKVKHLNYPVVNLQRFIRADLQVHRMKSRTSPILVGSFLINTGKTAQGEDPETILELIGFKPDHVETEKRIYDITLEFHLEKSSEEQWKQIYAMKISTVGAPTAKPDFHIHSETVNSTAAPHTEPVEEQTQLSILTYNIWNYNGNWTARKELIASIVQELNPDIVGFQEIREIWAEPESNQLQQLADLVPGYQTLYEPAMKYADTGREEGLGIFVRENIPIVQHKVYPLTKDNCGDGNSRIVFLTELLVGKRHVNFVDTHWSYDRHCQDKNAQETWELMKNLTDFTILVGDLNVYNDYLGPIDYLTKSPGDFKDVWSFQPDDSNPDGLTFKSWRPVERPDRVLMRETGGRVIAGKVVGEASEESEAPSDHCGVFVTFELEPIK